MFVRFECFVPWDEEYIEQAPYGEDDPSGVPKWIFYESTSVLTTSG